MMNDDELRERVRSGPLTRLLFDTNVVERDRRFNLLCDSINRLNGMLENRRIDMCISATAHSEKLFHLKQKHGGDYDPGAVMDALSNIGLKILAFDDKHARATAEFLGTRFPDRDAWRNAKRKRCQQCLGLKPDSAHGRNCSATIDWLIAAHAIAEECILVTDDRGPEFKEIEDKASLGSVERAVGKLLSDALGEEPT